MLGYASGDEFRAWPYGETFAHVQGRGPICKLGELRDWVADGTIERVK